MFKPDCSAFLVLINIGCNGDILISNEVFLVILGLIHVELKLSSFVFVVGRDVKIDGASGQNHDVSSIYISEVGFDWKFGLIEFLLT